MSITGKGLLRHFFHGKYSAGLVISFPSAEAAKHALKVLGDPWKLSEHADRAIVTNVDSDALSSLEDKLASFGANKKKISSLSRSIDYGEPWTITIP